MNDRKNFGMEISRFIMENAKIVGNTIYRSLEAEFEANGSE